MPPSVLSNTIVATGGRIINAFLGVLVVGVLTRLLGPANFGLYTLLLSFGALVQLLADFGLYLTLSREIAQHPEQEQHYLAQTFSLRAVLFAVAVAVGVVASRYINSLSSLTVPLLIAMCGLFFQSFSQLLLSVYQKYGLVWRAMVGELAGRIAQISTILVVALSIVTLNKVLVAFVVGTLLTFVVQYLLVPISRPRLWGFKWTTWKQLVRVSWPLGLLLVLNAIYFRVDAIILSLFRTPVEVGLYGLAYRVIESGLFFPAMLGGLLLPRLTASLQQNKNKQAARYVEEGFYLLAMVAGGVVTLLLYMPGPLILLVSGPHFVGAAPVLRILSGALVIMFFGNLFGFTLIALGRHRLLLGLYFCLVIVNGVGNWLFIPLWGMVAAAWTTVGTEAVALSVAAFVTYRALPFAVPWRAFARPLLAGAAVVALLSVVPPQWPTIVHVLLAATTYTVVIWQTGGFRKSQLQLLREISPVP